jgi:protein-tyrosine phosphatase
MLAKRAASIAALLLTAAVVHAQTAAEPLAAAQAAAAAALSASPSRTSGGVRFTPDGDSDVEPLEALGNFRTVEPGFYRSAQPGKDGYVLLHNLGVKTILTLKEDAARERARAEPLGMKVENVAMSGFKAPSFEQMDRALKIVTTAPRPLLLHCEHGKDRTGFVVAAYRVTVENRSVPDAVEEAKDAGCCFVLFEDLAAYLARYAAHVRAARR